MKPMFRLACCGSLLSLAACGGNFVVTDITTRQTATYNSGQRLCMADMGVAFDIAGTAGHAFRLYQAAFDRAADVAGLGFYINAFDNGVNLDVIAPSFIDSQEFSTTNGGSRTMNMTGSVNAATGYVTGSWNFSDTTGSGVGVALKAAAPAGPQVSQVRSIVDQHCLPCHSVSPTIPGHPSAPAGIRFDTETEIRNRAAQIYASEVQSQFMPYLIQTGFRQAERDFVGAWFQAGLS